MPFDDVDHPVDERNARDEKERAGGYRNLGRTIEAQGRRGAERSQKGGKDENQEVIHGMRLHPLPGGKTDERRGENDAHGRPVPAEQTTKGGIRQADRQQDENRVHTRLGDQLSVTVAQVGQRQVFIDGIPTQSAQIRITFEADRQRRDLHHTGNDFAAPFVVHGDDYAFLKTRQLNIHSLRGSDALCVADHTRSVHSRS